MSLLFLLSITVWLNMPVEEDSPAVVEPHYLPVSVVKRSPITDKVMVTSSGITQSRWSTAVIAAVGGRIIGLPDELEPGVMVSRDRLMAEIDPVTYQAEVDLARSRVAEAELSLARTRHEQTVVLRDKNTKSLTPLARHEPQVKAAKAEKVASESSLVQALQQLSDTRIKAPFDGIILDQKVTPAKWVQPGEELFVIADSHSIDIKVELPAKLWNRLTEVTPGMVATVTNRQGHTWPATVRYLSPVRDQKTRQRSLVLKVAEPYQGEHRLLPDQLVTVSFDGREYEDVFRIPASSVTDDGQVWTVDKDGRLITEDISVLYHADPYSTIVRFATMPDESRQIVKYPLGSMLKGQKVKPVLQDSGNGDES
ncbi:efflux RND transporter periplasmic adaptor subunit [Endozoicomonas montiporae]|uniref:efflux RND transporter periplasmic adaptor subunit n=1 Tax=Endozoicomonas montiporae TaxID=1027273 RepID=UPI001C9DBF51|nr:efflux RND transporter periplasmic adaptor subunit [Endozoicomonas montiporae]